MTGFRLLRRARLDLLDIGDFTARRWDDAQAERYMAELYAGFQELVDRPELRRPYRSFLRTGAHCYRATPRSTASPTTARFSSFACFMPPWSPNCI